MILEVALPVNINQNFDYISDEDIKIGCRTVVPFGNKKLTGFIVGIKEATNGSPVGKKSQKPGINSGLRKIIKVVDNEPLINDELLELAKWISEYYLCSFGVALNLILPSSSKISAKKTETFSRRSPSEPFFIHTSEQKNSIEKITEALKKNQSKSFLLFGPSDSGKTEIYIQAIDFCIKNNYSAIYLVPDVSLLSQFKELLRDNFGEAVGVWHSSLSQKEKNQFLSRLISGEIKVVLGSRSAIFLPLKNPKLFILDEEDDSFYKQMQSPKYHARDVATQRAKITKGVVVLGSATPSVETYYKMKTGEIELLKLTERIEKRPLPKISVINLKYTKRFALTKPLKYAISNALLQKKQIFLHINRRGWATVVRCSVCGNVVKCPKCSIPLVMHKKPSGLLCHYCGYATTQNYSSKCPVCSGDMIYMGFGTEKVEEIVKKIFPSTETMRIDADSEIPYSKMFRMMSSGKSCILIGTQIVAKGFDFPNLTVVGIINASSGLYSADFRSAERTFSLITNAIGRCGRGLSTGQVIIQTDNPEHYAIKYAAEFDYESFYEHEAAYREEFLWPPFIKLISITLSGKNEKTVISQSEKLAEKLDGITELTVLGPVPKTASYLASKHRWQILLKLKESDFPVVRAGLLRIANSHRKKDVNVVFDVDPLETV
ncbi:MAG: primosomal protein N' [Elusimicrobia bacterium CG06_land_8_20_14_3_00_38_11]|nr:MAG: primosomal protein N' [Elusimicrobia bacterium CG06_land_8_20_14_3_00_38_11]